jgi:ABC-type transport system involved in Fe-S cluster assembly fused permease/ATPase subunit
MGERPWCWSTGAGSGPAERTEWRGPMQLLGEQRIALARAVLKNARILRLNEATSMLDTVSERQVYDVVEWML